MFAKTWLLSTKVNLRWPNKTSKLLEQNSLLTRKLNAYEKIETKNKNDIKQNAMYIR